MKQIYIIVASVVCASVVFAAKADTELGLRKTPLGSESQTKLKPFKYTDKAPGESQVFDRAYENAPPMIPHSIEGLTDFTQESNACLDCHSPAVAKDMGATPLPKSHLYDLRNAKAMTEGIADSRWNCTQCHAPQAELKPAVKNNFKPEYRSKEGKRSSNLLEVLNEGVK